jgi:serine phosphatase RsbU (regulator of sigma subunit)
LTRGDLIVLYTDGITEAMNLDGDLFGDQALSAVLCATANQDPAAVRERVVRDVRAFVGEAEPHDDMTMVLVRIE